MFSVKKSSILNILTIICAISLVAVNSDEDTDKDANVEEVQVSTSKAALEEDVETFLNEMDKDSNQDENDSEKAEQPVTETVLVINEGNPELDEEIKEAVKDVLEEKEKEIEEDEDRSELSSEPPKELVSEENVEIPTSASPSHVKELYPETPVEPEEAPEGAYAVWNSKGKICLLAKFNATFSIVYPSKGGEQKAEIPKRNGKAKGKCESTTKTPLLQISWQKYVLTMMFNKSDEENWVVTSIELSYDTSDPLFDGATNAGKKTAKSKSLSIFETPVGKSFYCPAQEVVLLYAANKQVVTARLRDLLLQPFGIEDGKFSPVHRCNKVVLDGPDETPFVQDETVPLAVGCTLAIITLCILIGFSVHRAYNAAKVDYNNME